MPRKTLGSLLLMLLVCSAAQAGETDNRLPKEVPLNQPIFSDRAPDDQNVFVAIAKSKDEKLRAALGWQYPDQLSLRLKWHQSIPLQDGNYLLCLFDSNGRSYPGDAPRVLILFTSNYEVKNWGEFTCEPGFGWGSMVHPFFRPEKDSYFITVNPSGRNGGQLWFEKYRISPQKIEKLGEGPDPTKIPDP